MLFIWIYCVRVRTFTRPNLKVVSELLMHILINSGDIILSFQLVIHALILGGLNSTGIVRMMSDHINSN